MDALGPMVLNHDGTISRITNWDTLSAHEQATTFRLIAKRNAERKAKLEAQEAEAAAAATSPAPQPAARPTIGILGTGRMGVHLAATWGAAGYSIILGSRDKSKADDIVTALRSADMCHFDCI